jgi:hypothetical protein
MMNMRVFGLFAAQELSPSGQIKKKLPHFHGGACRSARGFDFNNLSTIDHHLSGARGITIPLTGSETHAADAGNAWQGLAPKSHCIDGAEVLCFLDFAGGVTFQAEKRIVAIHPKPIVYHPDQAAAAGLDFNRDAFCVGIESILDQLLHHAGRSLDDFTSRDLVRDLFGKQPNAIHAVRLK